jgi:hypothetical protein
MAAMNDYERAQGMVPDDLADLDEVDQSGVRIQRRGNTAVVDFNPGMTQTSADDSEDHAGNLADKLTGTEQVRLINTVIEQVAADLESRSDWQRRIDQAMELLGLRNEPLADLPFESASAVNYPLLGEACVQFQARAIEELFPSEGPAKATVVGKKTPELDEQAERVKDHMNYQMTTQDRAYFWHTDTMLFWLPIAGSAFKKTYYDPSSDMVVSRLVQSGDFIVPYLATDLRTSSRYTHRLRTSEQDMKRLMNSGFYRTTKLIKASSQAIDESNDNGQVMRDEADDRQQATHPEDHVYEVLEMHCDLELEMDQAMFGSPGAGALGSDKPLGTPLPYIVTIDKTSRTLLSIRRNWKQDDPLFTKRLWFTHYKYLPGLGFYGFGLLHLIGSVAESATGTLRALLDSAAFANLQGGFVSDEAKLPPGDIHIRPGVWAQVKMTGEEMQRAFYTPPRHEPSTALAQLFEMLTDTGRRFASITEEMTGDAANTGPVGTTIALIEQSQKVFSGVHRRLHVAQAEEFHLRAELNFEFLDDQYPYQVEGADQFVLKTDYDGRVDVIPVSDPNVFSTTQRIAQGQALIQLSAENPDLYDRRKVHERFLKAIRVPDYDELLKGGEKEHKRLDPVNENMNILIGSPAVCFPEQDHDAHIAVHMNFLQGLNEQALEMAGPAMQAHLAEHFALKYYVAMAQQMQQAGIQLPPPAFMSGEEQEEIDPQVETMIAQMAAQLPPMQIMPPDPPKPDPEAEFQAEERRKEEAFAADEERKSRAFDADQVRKDSLTSTDAERKMLASAVDVMNKDVKASQERDQKDASNAIDLEHQRAVARTKRLAKDRSK